MAFQQFEEMFKPSTQQGPSSDNIVRYERSSNVKEAASHETWTIQVLIDLYGKGQINLNPSYQRGDVWSASMRSDLINSLWNNFNIPPVLFNQIGDLDDGTFIFNTIDGKQRLTSFIKFFAGEIPVKISGHLTYAKYDPEFPTRKVLAYEQVNALLARRCAVSLFKNLTREIELEIFRRQQIQMCLTDGEKRRAADDDVGLAIIEIGDAHAAELALFGGNKRDYGLTLVTALLYMNITGKFRLANQKIGAVTTIGECESIETQKARCVWLIKLMAEKLQVQQLANKSATKKIIGKFGACIFAKCILYNCKAKFDPAGKIIAVLSRKPDVDAAFNMALEIMIEIGRGITWTRVIAVCKKIMIEEKPAKKDGSN